MKFNGTTWVQQGGYFSAWFDPTTAAQPTNNKFCKVQSFFVANISARYKINDMWTVHGSIDNVLNQQPPLDLNTYGGGNLPYNPSMHQAGAIGRFMSLGVVVKFQ